MPKIRGYVKGKLFPSGYGLSAITSLFGGQNGYEKKKYDRGRSL